MLESSSGAQPKISTAGTIAYMAPEQLQGKACYASDQYSLAIIAYEWICGEYPFTGTFLEIASQHMLTPPPSLNIRVPNLPLAVEGVIFKALAKAPKQRFAYVSDFAEALEEACQAIEQTDALIYKNAITSFAGGEGVTSQLHFNGNGTSLRFPIHSDAAKSMASSASAQDASVSSVDSNITYSTLKLPAQADSASKPPLPTDITHKALKSSHQADTTLPDRRYKRKLHFILLSAAVIALLIGVISMGSLWYGNMHAALQKGLLQQQPHLLSKSTPPIYHTRSNIPTNTPVRTTPIPVTQGDNTSSTPTASGTPGSTTNPQPVSSPVAQLSQSTPAATPDSIQGSTSNITFTATFHSAAPAPASFYLKNCGGSGSQNWQASVLSGDWLTLNPTTGSIDPGASSEIQIQANNDKLKLNTYTGSILFTAGTSSWTVTITYIVVKA